MSEKRPAEVYRVLIVDDEAIAVQAIRRIIEKNCPDFTVAGTAGNGQEALELLRGTHPDLVLTDIAMPILNGLELAQAARQEFPEMSFVVISGYQDFVYMRQAIQTGVLDYLAKPIVPSTITAMMERVRGKLRTAFYHRRNELLRSLCIGESVSEQEMDRLFPHSRYYAALLRENGLPRRFSRSQETEIFGNPEEAFSVYGRDSMEELHLIPAELLADQTLENYMEKLRERRVGADSYTTLLYYGKAFPAREIPKKLRSLYDALHAFSTVGLDQRIDLDRLAEWESRGRAAGNEELEDLLAELESLSAQGRYDLVHGRIVKAYQRWEEQQRTQLWLEQASRRILNFLRLKSGDEASLLESEYRLEDIFYYAASVTMLRENLHEIFFSFDREEREKPKVDSPEFFANVESYLSRHLADPLSLQTVSERFAISQAYMSRLFRKYAGVSYAQYLTRLRMERAKELMRSDPQLFVKDIAPLVGYQDQFYFSRLFRSYAGVSPADYMKSIEAQ